MAAPGFSGVRIPGLTCEELSLTGGDEAKSLFLPSKLAAPVLSWTLQGVKQEGEIGPELLP